MLLTAKNVLTLQKPTRTDYASVRGWFIDDKPLVPSENNFIRRKEDIVTLRAGRESATFDCFVERMLIRLDRMLENRDGSSLIKVCAMDCGLTKFLTRCGGHFPNTRASSENEKQALPLLRSKPSRCSHQWHNHTRHLHPDGLAGGSSIRTVGCWNGQSLRGHCSADRFHAAVRLRDVRSHGCSPSRTLRRIGCLLCSSGRLHRKLLAADCEHRRPGEDSRCVSEDLNFSCPVCGIGALVGVMASLQ